MTKTMYLGSSQSLDVTEDNSIWGDLVYLMNCFYAYICS